MNRENLAWVAGIMDGEGYIRGSLRDRPRSIHRHIHISINQCHPEMGQRLQQITGLGIIYKPKPPVNPKHSQQWWYRVNGFEEVQAFIAMIWPWLGTVKRDQATIALLRFRSVKCRGDYDNDPVIEKSRG